MFKVPIIIDLVQEALDNHYSVVVFVNFHDTMNYLCRHFKSDCTINGTQSFPLIEGIVCYLEIDGQMVLTKVRHDTFGMKWGEDDPACMVRDDVVFADYKSGSISEHVDINTLAKYSVATDVIDLPRVTIEDVMEEVVASPIS